MSFHRTIFVAVATLFTVGMTSGAFAGCGMWNGCGGWGGGWDGGGGSAGWSTGCGGCGVSYAPVTYAVPITTYAVPVTTYAQPLAPAPIEVGGCGCGGSAVYAAPPVAPAPMYVVNQGPDYTGPGVMEPYRTYNPAPVYAPTASYPYVPGYGPRPYYHAGPRYAYGARAVYRPHFYGPRFYRPGPMWHTYPRRGY
jgi:hypothetical protein